MSVLGQRTEHLGEQKEERKKKEEREEEKKKKKTRETKNQYWHTKMEANKRGQPYLGVLSLGNSPAENRKRMRERERSRRRRRKEEN